MPLWNLIDETPISDDGDNRRRTYRSPIPGGWLVLVTSAYFTGNAFDYEDTGETIIVPDPDNRWNPGSVAAPAPAPSPSPAPAADPGYDANGSEPVPEVQQGQGGGVPREVLAEALTASGFDVADVGEFLDCIVIEMGVHEGGVTGRDDVREILDAAVLRYGGSEYGKFTDQAVDAFVASLAASGIQFPSPTTDGTVG